MALPWRNQSLLGPFEQHRTMVDPVKSHFHMVLLNIKSKRIQKNYTLFWKKTHAGILSTCLCIYYVRNQHLVLVLQCIYSGQNPQQFGIIYTARPLLLFISILWMMWMSKYGEVFGDIPSNTVNTLYVVWSKCIHAFCL